MSPNEILLFSYICALSANIRESSDYSRWEQDPQLDIMHRARDLGALSLNQMSLSNLFLLGSGNPAEAKAEKVKIQGNGGQQGSKTFVNTAGMTHIGTHRD